MQIASIPGTYWQWQGHSIYYVKSGTRQPERPPLLLIHGFGASTDHWKKNIAGLDRMGFEVWAIDLLGFGRSAKPNLDYAGSLWRDQLHDFISEVIRTPAVLAGNSLGGYASLCLAAERPESSAGLILLNSAGPFSSSEPEQKSNEFKDSIAKLIRSILLQSWANYFLFKFVQRKSFIRKTLQQVYLNQDAVTEELIEDLYRPSLDSGAPQVFASVFKSRSGKKVDELLTLLNCPLLMLWGEGDPWMNARDRGAKYRQYYPQLTEHYLHAGHCPHDEIPEEVNTKIGSWVLSSCSSC